MFTLNFYRMLRAVMTGVPTSGTISYQRYNGTTENYDGSNIINALITFVTDGRAYRKYGNTSVAGAGMGLASIPDNVASESAFEGINVFKYWANGSTPSTANISNERAVIMVLGDGTTAPTINDYKLESFIGSDVLKCINVTSTCNNTISENSDELAVKSWTFENISDSPITVKEVGLVGLFGYGDNTCHSGLLYREVLTEPVTIPAGKTYRFDFTLKVKF